MIPFMISALFSATVNLVPNGGFEEGYNGAPDKWQRPDGLTSFWIKDSVRKGRCLKIDTDVYKDEYLARQEEMKKKPVPPAKRKTPTKGEKYDTIAGVDGVSFYSEWIPVEKGQYFRLEIDTRTDGAAATPKVFIKGYFLDTRRPVPYQRRVIYKKYLKPLHQSFLEYLQQQILELVPVLFPEHLLPVSYQN